MIIFKESTHSILGLNKEDILLTLAALPGVKELFNGAFGKNNLNDLFEKLPNAIKQKLISGSPLNRIEENKEMEIASRESGISFRPTPDGRNALQALNDYYHETNPVSVVLKN